jgi:AcrR family transcriptional regulator
MSPRPYKLGKRKVSIDETRTRILEATRKLLASGRWAADLSMEAIARKADVSRLTIYYQFGSRAGLLEALYDHLASRGKIRQVADVFQESDPNRALEKMVRTFVHFWASDAEVIRRLRGMSALDAEIDAGIRAREARRRHIASEIIKRFHLHQLDPRNVAQQNLAADVLATLTSFETYDALSRSGHDDAEITQIVVKLARTATRGGIA